MVTKENLLAKGAMVANCAFGAVGVFCGVTLWHYFYYYFLIRERHFTSWVDPVLVYVLPVVLGSLMFAAMRLKPLIRIKILVLLLAIVVSVFTAELLLLEEEARAKAKVAKEFGVPFDTRDRLEVIGDLQRGGTSASPVIAPHNLLRQENDGSVRSMFTIGGKEILPLGGIAKKATIFCNENGQFTMYASDEHGFHNPGGLWNARPIDIAALGDSFTLGACVPSDKNFVAIIRRHYPATLNLGVNGIGPLIELAVLKEYLVKAMKPKVVLWFYFEGNDLLDLMREQKSPLLIRYLHNDFSQSLFARQTDIDRALATYVEGEMAKETARRLNKWLNIIKLSDLRGKLDLVQGRLVNKKEEVPTKETLDLFAKILLRAKTYVNGWHGKLIFVYLTDWVRYHDPAVADKYREQILTLITALDLPLVDIHEAFEAQKDPLALFPFGRDGHYNEAGHRIVAEQVLKVISLNKSIGADVSSLLP